MRFLKDFFSRKYLPDNRKEADWIFAEINPKCKLLIYEYCVEEFSRMIKNEYPDSVFLNTKNKSLLEAVRDAHVLVGWKFPEDLLGKALNLKWIQLISAALDLTEKKYTMPANISNDVVITTVKGLYSGSVADYVIWAILTQLRKFHLILSAQANKNWTQHIGEDTKGKVVGILGLGSIGNAVAEKIKIFGMEVFAIKRNYASSQKVPNIDRLYPITELADFLCDIDFLILCLPLTSETRGLIGKNEFSHMKKSAFVVDVSRGGIIKYKDLIWAIKNKIISGAVLDVFENEPLPKDSELWDFNNVIITPHISGLTAEYANKVGSLFCDNLQRFIEGRDLNNIVDRAKGY